MADHGEAYTFMLLSDEEILLCLRGLNIAFTPADLKAPTKASIRPVYEALVSILLGADKEDPPAAVAAASEVLDFPELYDMGVEQMHFRKRLLQVMKAAGVDDFSMGDVFHPAPKRTKRSLSALINFAKFREERLARYQSLSDQSDALLAQHERVTRDLAHTHELVAGLEARREAEAPQVAELVAANEELTTRLTELNAEQSAVRAEIQATKDAMTRVRGACDEMAFNATAARQTLHSLRAQIVSSPARLKSAVENAKASLAADRTALAETQDRAKALAAQLDAIATLETTLTALVAQANETTGDYERCVAADATLQEHNSRADKAAAQLGEYTAGEELLGQQLLAVNEKVRRFNAAAKTKREAVTIALESARTEHRACEREFASAKAKLDENAAAIRELTGKRDTMLEAHERDLAKDEQQLDLMRDAVRTFHKALFETMAAAPVNTAAAALASSRGPSGGAPLASSLRGVPSTPLALR